MKILVLIDNNLKHDNRVKRHVTAMLEEGHRVTLLAQPRPDAEPGLVANGMEMIFWSAPAMTLDAQVIRRLAERLGVLRQVFTSFPAALSGLESLDVLGPIVRRIQSRQLECSWWAGFRSPVCQEDVSPLQDFQSVLATYEYMLRWAEYACRYEADCIYCNDLFALLAGVAHKGMHHSRLIFDAHEIFYDIGPGLHTRLWKQALALLERQLVQAADAMLGVSESHVDWMRTTYNPPCEVLCVPNSVGLGQDVPPPPPPTTNPGNTLRVYYHGASDRFRGLDNIVTAVAQVPQTRFVMRCMPSSDFELVEKAIQQMGVRDRVSMLPLVGSGSLIDAIRAEADVGIHAHELPRALNIKVA
jgi:hypothetical protein